jgi:non-canonical (house-cleaning) NTP pyrophosphatase
MPSALHKRYNSVLAYTGLLFLPPKVASLVRSGVELGKANDIVFQKHNTKHDSGAVGLVTQNLITRAIYYEHAAILALAPIINAELYAAE